MNPVATELEQLAQEAAGAPRDGPTLTDTGNASRLVSLHGDRLHYILPWHKWIVANDDGFWEVDYRDVCVRELAKDVGCQLKEEAASEPDKDRAKRLFGFGLQSLNAHKISAMVDLARGIDGVRIAHEELDADGWLLGIKNGVIDLRTGELRTTRPENLMTLRAPVSWAWLGKHLGMFTNRIEHGGSIETGVSKLSDEELVTTVNRAHGVGQCIPERLRERLRRLTAPSRSQSLAPRWRSAPSVASRLSGMFTWWGRC